MNTNETEDQNKKEHRYGKYYALVLVLNASWILALWGLGKFFK